jgi:Tfp pilus assembly PilM family ATPase
MSSYHHLGLEINDRSIRYMEISQIGKDFILGKYGEVALPAGYIENGAILEGIRLNQKLALIQKKGNWKSVTVSHIPGQIYLSDILLESGFKHIYFEKSGEALARTLVPKNSTETFMIVYFSGDKLEIYEVSKKGGALLSTSNFSSSLFDHSDKEMINLFIKEKIDEQYISWHTHKEEGKTRPKIAKIILAGDLPEPEKLAEYLTRSLKIPTELASAWKNVFSFEKHIPEMPFRESLRYVATIGLALRPFEK